MIAVYALVVAAAWPPAVVNGGHGAICANTGAGGNALGYGRTHGSEQGARAYLDQQSLHYCSASGVPDRDDDRGTSAWVAVTGPAGGYNIIQMGIVRCLGADLYSYCDGSLIRVFAWGRQPEAPGCAGFSRVPPIGIKVGTVDTSDPPLRYKVLHAGGLWGGYVGALKEAHVLESSICWTPEDLQYFTETMDDGDAHGGTDSNHFYFAEVQGLGTEGGGWSTFEMPGCVTYSDAPDPTFYKCSIEADDRRNMRIWTLDH
ncbi:MAG: hypothetical protein H0V04_05505 [Chloroflexi bacterium]|nr:hypothetical protein [Chloroflexota bacterium]